MCARARFEVGVGVLTLFLVTGAVNLQMPLFQRFAEGVEHRHTIATLVFAAYVVGLLPTLLFMGGLSDRVGRKIAMLLGLSCSGAATAIMLVQPSLPTLFVARVLQGIGVGVAVAAASAFLAERLAGARKGPGVERHGPVVLVAVSTSLGFGGGALFTGSILLFSSTLRPWSQWVFVIATAACLVAVSTLPREPLGANRLVRLPHYSRETVPAAVSIALAWAVTGVVIGLVPGKLGRELAPWAGHALFVVNAAGVAVQPLARRSSSSRALATGFVLLPVGYACLVTGATLGLLPVLVVGSALAGAACYGFTYVGGLALVNEHTTLAERARGISGYFLAAYVGFGLPTVGLGVLADRSGLQVALVGFGAVLTAACGVMLAATVKHAAAP